MDDTIFMRSNLNQCRIVLFRHGETDWNKEERWQGHSDIPLNACGREQAKLLASKLTDIDIECILSSDLMRAQETAKIVSDQIKVPVIAMPSLREVHGGLAEGLTRREIKERFGEEIMHK